MAQSRAESTRDTYNYGQYFNQFPLNTIKVIREFERIQKKICRHKMSIMFNETCITVEMLPKYIYIYIYIYIYYRVVSVTLCFILYAFIRQSERFSKKKTINMVNFFVLVVLEGGFCLCVCVPKFMYI